MRALVQMRVLGSTIVFFSTAALVTISLVAYLLFGEPPDTCVERWASPGLRVYGAIMWVTLANLFAAIIVPRIRLIARIGLVLVNLALLVMSAFYVLTDTCFANIIPP